MCLPVWRVECSSPAGLTLVWLRESVAVGIGHQLKAIGDAQLVEDRREVVDDRRLADRHALADLSVFQALANQRDDLAFAFGQRGDYGRLGVGVSAARARS